jgi:hypothetical protein
MSQENYLQFCLKEKFLLERLLLFVYKKTLDRRRKQRKKSVIEIKEHEAVNVIGKKGKQGWMREV